MSADVSIIVCTRDRAANLRGTLASLAALRVPPGWKADLHVVDNGSADETPAVVEEARFAGGPVNYWREDRPGQVRARNRGLRESGGRVLLWTDDDVRVPPTWLEAMARPILDGAADATTGEIHLAPHLERPWLTDAHRGHLLDVRDLAEQHARQPFLIGANMAFSRHVLREVPGFDPDLGPGASGFMDDTLFYLQLGDRGFRLKFVPGHAVEHHCDASRLTRSAQLRSARAHGRSSAWVKHHWEHEATPLRRVKMLRNAVRLLGHKLRHRRHAGEGFDPLELMYETRFWTYRTLGRLRDEPRLYARRASVRLADQDTLLRRTAKSSQVGGGARGRPRLRSRGRLTPGSSLSRGAARPSRTPARRGTIARRSSHDRHEDYRHHPDLQPPRVHPGEPVPPRGAGPGSRSSCRRGRLAG